jgi:hypothetical protein
MELISKSQGNLNETSSALMQLANCNSSSQMLIYSPVTATISVNSRMPQTKFVYMTSHHENPTENAPENVTFWL